MAIPKFIHYCWFGGKPKGKLVDECLESWKKILPHFEIKEWNESNYSSDSFFFNECISKNKFAFASDYARFDILYKLGGIYMDTDMLVLNPLNNLLNNDCFFGYETENNISCGIIGSVVGDTFISIILNELNNVMSNTYFNNYTIVQLVNKLYRNLNNSISESKIAIYPIEYFYPYPYGADGNPLSYKSKNTYAIHLWSASWMNDYQRSQLLLAQGKKKEARQLFIKLLFSKPHYLRFISKYL